MNLYQRRDFGQKINATFEFIRENWRPLLLCLLYIVIPVTLVISVIQIYLIQELLGGPNSMSINRAFMAVPTTSFASILFSMLNVTLLYVTVNAYILEYEDGNRNITPGQVWQRVSSYILPCLWLTVVGIFATLLGLVLFAIPGYYVAGTLPLMYIVMMREQRGSVDTIFRCQDLTQSPWWSPVVASFILSWLLFLENVRRQVHNWWSTVALLFIAFVIQFILSLVFQLPTMLLTDIGGLSGFQSGDFLSITSVLTIISSLGGTIVSALIPIAVAFQYYNFLAQLEGTDLLSAIDNIGVSSKKSQLDDEGEY